MDDQFTTNCYVCKRPFTPAPARVKIWAESGQPFDPTDWTCPACAKAQRDYLNQLAHYKDHRSNGTKS